MIFGIVALVSKFGFETDNMNKSSTKVSTSFASSLYEVGTIIGMMNETNPSF
jgi:hypothetical protein